MSEFCDISSMNEIPEQCIGCPLVEFRQQLASEIVGEAGEQLTKLDELYDTNFENLKDLHDMTSKPNDTYEAICTDLTAISSIVDLMPDSADMTLHEFLRIYRTDENGLGDQAFSRVLERIQDDAFAQRELTVSQAIEVVRKSAEGFKATYDEQPLVENPDVQKLLGNNDEIAERIEQSKQRIKDLANPIIESHRQAIDELVGNCPDGVKEKTVGLFKKRVVKYCGSKALM
jgi:hypothetical protein